MAKKAAIKPAAKKRPAKRKLVDSVVEEFGKITPDDMKRLLDSLRNPVEPAIDLSEKDVVKSSSPWRRSIKVAAVVAGLAVSFVGGVYSAGGWQIGPGPVPADSVSAVFDAQEAAFRKYSGELSVELKSGRISSEKAAADWMDSHFGPESEKAWIPLITEESKAFGGKDWTAEKQAAHIERYAR